MGLLSKKRCSVCDKSKLLAINYYSYMRTAADGSKYVCYRSECIPCNLLKRKAKRRTPKRKAKK